MGITMIADISWMIFYSGIALGVLLTALVTYVVASVGRQAGRSPLGPKDTASVPASVTASEQQRRAA
jgi:hypothetical protein